MKKIFTVGHSTHHIEEFLAMLHSFEVRTLVDVRRLPGSRRHPQFDQENLKISLEEAGLRYLYFADLGGRRKAKKDSKNTRWNNVSFKGYADYMETEQFKNVLVELEKTALASTTVYMCAEVLWWRCHRSMISDNLKAKGWNVFHIMGIGKAQEHSYTQPALVTGEKVSYAEEN